VSGARLVALAVALMAVARIATAHDLITAETAERYLAQADRNLAVIRSRDPVRKRAEARLELARMQDEIRDLLNRDLAMHGRVQGLPSTLVVERLRAAGAPLPWSERLGRYAAPIEHYRAALELGGQGTRTGDAIFGLLSGSFYDSFRDDPLRPVVPDPALTRSLIELGERFEREFPRDANIEEARFITAVAYVRAAREGVDAQRYAARARELLLKFGRDYPDSLRTAALPIMADALPR